MFTTIFILHKTDQQLEEQLQTEFIDFLIKFNKKYSGTEFLYRLEVYKANLNVIKAKNQIIERKIFGLTQFADLTDEEFIETYLNLKIAQTSEILFLKESIKLNGNPIDWRSRGAVNEVQDQGQCGSSDVFSSLGSVEGFFKITTGELPRLSAQQIVDCQRDRFPGGCNGGLYNQALNYVIKNGVTTNDEYPYTGYDQGCSKKGGPYKMSGFSKIAQNEEAFLSAMEKGPLQVAVQASNWKYYQPTEEDYIFPYSEFLAVGYTNEAVIIKNSWSTKWGLKGYIYLEKGINACQIWDDAIIPF
ncbi:unnamed protein product [Paramecium primaurelia]|uniref:Papain family cysteine protease n=1 Tax=Paramecium primaurelia TaxID=5886 RepID=A0A8S1JVE6_PARPR|nr:unnamed protein product [Paramecium primaurelia]CAD8044440.1 unnamed protein product [Paramecium primaurelia]